MDKKALVELKKTLWDVANLLDVIDDELIIKNINLPNEIKTLLNCANNKLDDALEELSKV